MREWLAPLEPHLPQILGGGLVLLLVLLALRHSGPSVYYWLRRRGSRSFPRAAEELGMSYQASGRAAMVAVESLGESGQAWELGLGCSQFPFFLSGYRGRVHHLMRGTRPPFSVYLFNYHHSANRAGRDTPNIERQTVAAFECLEMLLPTFELHPVAGLDRIKSKLGLQPINFDDSPVFSSHYRVNGPEVGRVRALFSPWVRTLLSEHPGLWVQGGGTWIIVYRTRTRLVPDQWPAFFAKALELSQAISKGADWNSGRE